MNDDTISIFALYPRAKKEFDRINDALQAGDGPLPTATVRQLLGWFGAKRRGRVVVSDIRLALREAGLMTQPDFSAIYIDGELDFAPIDDGNSESSDQSATASESSDDEGEDDRPDEPSIGDPVLRIGMLPAANNPPVTVTRDDSVRKARTLMMSHDYSQLPATQDKRRIDGMISWRSISMATMRDGRVPSKVRECLESRPPEEIRSAEPISRAFQKIIEREAVLVRGDDGKISGIVTATDLSVMFREQTESFLQVSEIENQLRRIIMHGNFTNEELASAGDSGDSRREIQGVHDLTFGECIRLIEHKQHWERLGLPVDRKVFVKLCDEVRNIRNDVVHFDPDGLTEVDLERLASLRRLLRQIDIPRVTDA